MSDNINLNKVDINVVNGWNRRKRMGSMELSRLTPFVLLIGIVDSFEKKIIEQILNNEFGQSNPALRSLYALNSNGELETNLLEIEFPAGNVIPNMNQSILDNTSEGPFHGVLIGSLNSQLSFGSNSPGIGIKSLTTEKSTRNPFTEVFRLEMTVTDPNLINNNYELQKLLNIGSGFLIMYGWSDGNYIIRNKKIYVNFDENNPFNDGMYRPAITQLYKFEGSFDDVGHLDLTLGFIASHTADFIFNKASASKIGNSIRYFMRSRFLQNPSVDTINSLATRYDLNKDEMEGGGDFDEDVIKTNFISTLGDIEEQKVKEGSGNDYTRYTTNRMAQAGLLGNVRIYLSRAVKEGVLGSTRASDKVRNEYVFELGSFYGGRFRFSDDIPSASNPVRKITRSKRGIVETGEGFDSYIDFMKAPGSVYQELDSKGNTSGAYLDIKGLGGTEVIASAAQNQRLGSRFGDNFFVGKQLVADGSIDKEDWMDSLPEGIITTHIGRKTVSSVIVDINGNIERAELPVVIEENMPYYYLGWVIAALDYYDKQYGGNGLNIRHSNFVNQKVLQEPKREFMANYNKTIRRTILEGGETYGTGATKITETEYLLDYGASLIAGEAIPKLAFDFPEDPNAPSRSEINYPDTSKKRSDRPRGLYLSEAESRPEEGWIGYDIPIVWTDANPYIEIWKRGDGGDDSEYIPEGQPIIIPSINVGQDDTDTAIRIEPYGGKALQEVEGTFEVPLYANIVDDILSDSNLKISEMLDQILNDAIALPGLSITTRTKPTFTELIAVNTIPEDNNDLSLRWGLPENLTDSFILDYKSKESLIENISINSTLDPNVGFVQAATVRSLGGNVLNTLAYINQSVGQISKQRSNLDKVLPFSSFVAAQLSKGNYGLDEEEKDSIIRSITNNKELIDGFVTVSDNVRGRDRQLEDLIQKIPESIVSDYIAQDYRFSKYMSLFLLNEGTYVNKMFTYYLNRLSTSIHGTVGIFPYEFLQLRNIIDMVDGYYSILSVNDNVNTQGFTTNLELMLVVPKSDLNNDIIPVERADYIATVDEQRFATPEEIRRRESERKVQYKENLANGNATGGEERSNVSHVLI